VGVFLREVKANLKSLFTWSVVVVVFVVVGVSKFSAYYNNPEMLVVIEALPPALLDAFSFQMFNLTTVSGFFGLMFNYYALLLSIAAVMWGSDIIVKEERDKTVEFSLTLPLSRGSIVASKMLAAFVNCLGLLLVTWVVSIVSVQGYSPEAGFYRFLALCMAAILIMQVIFLAVGIALGCAMKRYKQAGFVAVSVLLGTYFISILVTLNKDLDFLRFISPFKYFDAGLILRDSWIDPFFVGLSLLIVVVCLGFAFFSYSRRDLYI
jgi:ABC-2 type transport system permease protein